MRPRGAYPNSRWWGSRNPEPSCNSGPVRQPTNNSQLPPGKPEKLLSRFVSDVTIQDGTQMPINSRFSKIWKIRNEGVTAWPENTCLAYVGGDQLAKVDTVLVGPISSGVEVDITIDMVAPPKQGRYVGYWRLQIDGIRFGQRVWVDISVTESPETVHPPILNVPTPIIIDEPTPVLPKDPIVLDTPVVINPIINNNNNDASPGLKQLLEMGFTDREFLQGLLNANSGDVIRTVQQLLHMK